MDEALSLINLLQTQKNKPSSGVLFGHYRGFCISNQDPQKLGRIKAYIPTLHGPKVPSHDTLNWCWPCSQFGGYQQAGTALIPDVTSGVWVTFENGDTQFPIWVGTWWSRPEGQEETPSPTYEGSDPSTHVIYHYGDMKITAKKDGSILKIELSPDTNQHFEPDVITIKCHNGIVTIKDNLIHGIESGGSEFTFNNGSVTIHDKLGASLILTEGNATLIDDAGAIIALSGGSATITDNNQVNLAITGGLFKFDDVQGSEMEFGQGHYSITTPTLVSINSPLLRFSTQQLEIQAQDVELTTGTFNINADTVKINSPNTEITNLVADNHPWD